MNKQIFFRYAIRAVFLFAFVAFLSASVSHIAVFFNNFEADKNNWIGSYMLAVSIDLTSLMLTIGIMFFRKDMPWYAQVVTITFIIFLTAFSWVVNWEYARTNQGINLETDPLLEMINPILASSFAFLNLAYSFVSEFFNARVQTADDLQAEADRLENLEQAQKRIDAYRERNRKSSLIQRAKETLIEAKEAVIELKNGTDEEVSLIPDGKVLEEVPSQESGTDEEFDTPPEVEALNVIPFHPHGTTDFPKVSIKDKIARKRLFTVAQAAEELQCTQRHVRNLRKEGTLATNENGLIVGSSLKAYIARRRVKV